MGEGLGDAAEDEPAEDEPVEGKPAEAEAGGGVGRVLVDAGGVEGTVGPFPVGAGVGGLGRRVEVGVGATLGRGAGVGLGLGWAQRRAVSVNSATVCRAASRLFTSMPVVIMFW